MCTAKGRRASTWLLGLSFPAALGAKGKVQALDTRPCGSLTQALPVDRALNRVPRENHMNNDTFHYSCNLICLQGTRGQFVIVFKVMCVAFPDCCRNPHGLLRFPTPIAVFPHPKKKCLVRITRKPSPGRTPTRSVTRVPSFVKYTAR